VGLVGDAVIPVLKGLGRPSRVTLLGVIQSGLLILLAWEFAGRFGAVGAGLTWLVATGATQVLGIYLLRQLLPQVWVGIAPSVAAIVAASLAGAAAAWGIVRLEAGLAGLVAAIAASGLITIGLFWTLDRWLKLNLARNLARAFPEVVTAWTLVTRFPRPRSAAPPEGGLK
jgi:hypothetical protein